MDRPAYDQSAAPPPTNQPYPPMAQLPPPTTTQEAHSSQAYPQYPYDIQMRYPEDQNRPYSQDHNGHPPPQVPRQYTSLNSPYAQPSKEGPTSPYQKEVNSPYESRDGPVSLYGKENVNHYHREAAPTSPYPPMNGHYSAVPQPHSPTHHHPVQLPPMSMSMQGHPHEYGPPPPMVMDTTGQVAPAGMKPRVTATLWEDEGTLCFQVDVKGTCVARREDNHMVNGTKLLNVAGMTRGRRDGILKAEKQKHVVKIGPMHLKGVWIPYDRALTFANKENITPLLYPLFVHNIGALLYHPINNGRAGPPGYPQLPRRAEENGHQPPTSPEQQQLPQQQYQPLSPPLQYHHQPPPNLQEAPRER